MACCPSFHECPDGARTNSSSYVYMVNETNRMSKKGGIWIQVSGVRHVAGVQCAVPRIPSDARHHVAAAHRDVRPGDERRQVRSQEGNHVGYFLVGAASAQRNGDPYGYTGQWGHYTDSLHGLHPVHIPLVQPTDGALADPRPDRLQWWCESMGTWAGIPWGGWIRRE